MENKSQTEIKFQTEVLQRLSKIEEKLDDYKTIRNTATEANHRSKENEKDIAEIKEKIKWLTRTIAAALITGVIGIIFVCLKIGLGIG